DWIGSMEEYFPYIDAPLDPANYVREAAQHAHNALEALQWTGWQPAVAPAAFTDLFPFAPNAVQQEAIKLAAQLDDAALIIVEVTTGAGKTETALYLADHQGAVRRQRGLYIAMPTMATSNQMFSRASTFLQNRYQTAAARPLLIHSQARWLQDNPPPALSVEEDLDGTAAAATRDMSWFLPRKRSLLTPFGVGTVDQTLLSVLQTRHFFVRLFALSNKTIIFDEVHAYDVYMSELFQQLLRWLRMVGATVILLSATLPAATRRRLVEAYTGTEKPELTNAPYPSITWASGAQSGVIPLAATEARPPIALHRIDRNPQSVVEVLATNLKDGGCAAVICNTIDRAQAIYKALAEAALVPPTELILFHARTPFAWRDEIEKNVLDRFGKEGANRPQKAIVVATQVIEQSLDLDFDFMISDLAPVDLLLQRAGRLHRHPRPVRPKLVSTPSLSIAVNETTDIPDWENDGFIYEPYILLRTYLTLRDATELLLPVQTASLIEAVYDETSTLPPLSPALTELLTKAAETMMRNQDKARAEAKNRLIPKPNDEDLLSKRSPGLEEDSPELHSTFQALTRLGKRTIAVVCLHQTAQGLNTEPDG
ncbi:MAG: CRISPR-associated helicase Cas3', partial [Caldilineaceae bacterium]|nr:CRISPR-associated helicase Cas3' [Caldilineaceae bacterium]